MSRLNPFSDPGKAEPRCWAAYSSGSLDAEVDCGDKEAMPLEAAEKVSARRGGAGLTLGHHCGCCDVGEVRD